jgi:hypothetical protein
MLRTSIARFSSFGFQQHTVITKPKYTDKPGYWSRDGGPAKDTLARRFDFYRLLILHKIGRVTAPFRTKRAVFIWRTLQARVWKTTVLTIVFISMLVTGNLWLGMCYHAYTIGPSTPVLERKVREHRVSKQILQMVRERERDLQDTRDSSAAAEVLAQKNAAK